MFLKELLKEGLIVRSGITWGCSNFIRVTIGAPCKNQRFIKAFKEVMGS